MRADQSQVLIQKQRKLIIMLRLVVISVLVSVVSVQAGTVVGGLLSEKVVESHGNSVVHASAPLVATVAAAPLVATVAAAPKYTNVALVQQPIAEIAQPLAKASLVAEKTIEAHGHQVVHDARPLVALAKPLESVAIPTVAARDLTYALPVYYSYPHLVAEKTVSSYGHSVRHVA